MQNIREDVGQDKRTECCFHLFVIFISTCSNLHKQQHGIYSGFHPDFELDCSGQFGFNMNIFNLFKLSTHWWSCDQDTGLWLAYNYEYIFNVLRGSAHQTQDSAMNSPQKNNCPKYYQNPKLSLLTIIGVDEYFCQFNILSKMQLKMVILSCKTIWSDYLFFFSIFFLCKIYPCPLAELTLFGVRIKISLGILQTHFWL